jgi:DnaJ-domain-containing protein 1
MARELVAAGAELRRGEDKAASLRCPRCLYQMNFAEWFWFQAHAAQLARSHAEMELHRAGVQQLRRENPADDFESMHDKLERLFSLPAALRPMPQPGTPEFAALSAEAREIWAEWHPERTEPDL